MLRLVVDRQWLRGRSGGLWDVLECGHALTFYGVKRLRRDCPECDHAPVEHPTLFEEPA